MTRFMKRLVSGILPVLLLALTAGLSAALAQTAAYQEAPQLTGLVKAGKLPPVEKRLPENPLIVPVVEKTGDYGEE